MASSSSSTQQNWRYDVFLSFRGEDTRNNFTSHLYKELSQKGIVTFSFKDDRELRKGEIIPQELPKAIRDSRILVVIFSKNYATSTWCLDELVEIFKRKKDGRQIVLPIFYDVNPSEVRKQVGQFGEPFTGYEIFFKDNIEKVQQWRDASTEVGNISGWHLNERVESEFIEDIVEDILGHLRRLSHSIAKDFVGMESILQKMNDYLDLGQRSTVQTIGICGMGGIGKTTIAKVVYKDIYCQFEGSYFIENVRESCNNKAGIVALQKQLLSATLMHKSIRIYNVYEGTDMIRNRLCDKQVLVILDDVDQLEQLTLLIGKRDEHWFGNGSRIIITTRNEHILKHHGVDEIYKVTKLNQDDALKLFCSRACKNNYYNEEYMELCYEFVKYASGLPLALDVLGSSLLGRSVREWRSTLDSLKEIPNEEILSKLELSYEELDRISKNIFLDIACFFKGESKDYVMKVLESCGLFPESRIGGLIDKSLLTISSSGYVWMHDLIQEMGREIVRRESCENPGQRSRIWLDKDVNHVQVKNIENKQVQGIVLSSWKQETHLSVKIFSKMKELRLLILKDIPTFENVENLSNELRYLEWYRCPFKTFPTNFQPDKLVQLHMKFSNIEQLWKKAIKPIKLLKIIDLSYSKNLIKILDFHQIPNLEELNLEGCESLPEVHQSIGVLKKLVGINLKNCKNLVTLPDSMCKLKSLKTLILHGCSKLKKVPNRLGDLTSLVEFDATTIGVQQMELANQWDFLRQSRLVPWTWRKNRHPIVTLLPSLAFNFLKELNLSHCNLPEGSIPNDLINRFPLLEVLNLTGNNFTSLPSSIGDLSRLNFLYLFKCERLQSLPNLPCNILYLNTQGCSSLGTSLLKARTSQHKLENVCNPNCERLQSIPGLATSVVHLIVEALTEEETSTSQKPLELTFLNRILLIEEVHCKNCPASARLKIYLHFLLKHYSQGLFNPFSSASMCLTGSEVPELCNYRGKGSTLEVQLPPCWCDDNWWGFTICVVSEDDDELSFSKNVSIFYDLQAWDMSDKSVALGRFNIETSGDLTTNMTEKIWYNFISDHSLGSVYNQWEEIKKLKMSFYSNGLKVKCCGFSAVYKHDVVELIQCNRLD